MYGHFTMVALDEKDKPTEIPGLLIENGRRKMGMGCSQREREMRMKRRRRVLNLLLFMCWKIDIM